MLVLILAGLGVLLFLNQILFPFILAIFLAYVLAPAIERMHQWRIHGDKRLPRGAAVILLYLALLLVLGGFSTYLVPRISSELARMVQEVPGRVSVLVEEWQPVVEKQLESWQAVLPSPPEPVASLPDPELTPAGPASETDPLAPDHPLAQLLEGYVYEVRTLDAQRIEIIPKPRVPGESQLSNGLTLNERVNNLLTGATESLSSDLLRLVTFGRQLVTGVAGSVFTLFLTFMVAGFILVDTNRIAEFWKSFIPHRYTIRMGHLMEQLDEGLNGVVRGQIIICLVNGFLTLVGLLLLGIPFAVTLALVATLFSLIPIFGTILSSVPIIVMGLTVSFSTGLLALAWILLIHFIEANFLNPKIMGTAAHIHPAIIVFALMTGEHLAGIAGALLAVPIYSILQTLFLFLKCLVEELEREPLDLEPN